MRYRNVAAGVREEWPGVPCLPSLVSCNLHHVPMSEHTVTNSNPSNSLHLLRQLKGF